MPFPDPVVAGGGALIKQAIHSPNYSPGVAGWSINRDGSAEFANALLRGALIAGLPPAQLIAGPAAELPPPLDSYLETGICWIAGDLISYYGVRPLGGGGGYITEVGVCDTTTPPGTIYPQNYTLMSGGFPILTHVTEVRFEGFDCDVLHLGNETQWNSNADPSFPGLYTINGKINTSFWDEWVLSINALCTVDAACDITAANLTNPAAAFTLGISGTSFSLGNGVAFGEQRRRGGDNIVRFQFTFGSTSAQGTSAWTLSGFTASVAGPNITNSVPVGRWWYVKPASTQRASGDILMVPGASSVALQAGGGLPTLGAFTGVGQNVPEAWPTGAILMGEFRYPIS
jgi:hypothetical protein